MPMYVTLTSPGLLSAAQREAFARAVVEVHCGVTGAPPSFVHVLYADDDRRGPGEGPAAVVSGTIRHGRTPTQKQEIIRRLRAALAAVAGIDTETVEVRLTDIDASHVMEGGRLLPEPGSAEEQEWKALGTASGSAG